MKVDYRELVHTDRVHGSLLHDPEIFADEMERIFVQGWVFVGHESEVKNGGDWVKRQLGNESVLMVRAESGEVNVLANRCSHRGTALCWEHKGNAAFFQCTYHNWRFGLDGDLRAVPFPDGYSKPKEDLGLDRAGQIAVYRGFVFANLDGLAGTIDEHLGPAGYELIDRLCEMSPSGKIDLSKGWIGHRVQSNWKLWPESDSDGYHVGFVHASMSASTDTYYDDVAVGGDAVKSSRAVDYGRGHLELDWRPSYKKELSWLGITRDRVKEYYSALAQRVGNDLADQMLWDGPPHAFLFPNLFLGETVIAIVEPVSPGEMIHHHTSVQFDGADDAFNERLLRQTEAAVGPASFITTDDAITAERIQAGVSGTDRSWSSTSRGWIDLSRGLHREEINDDGVRSSDASDETTNRGFWYRYLDAMSGKDRH
ncbi:MAG: Rieske 2Fe-2S domain-containing protein [Acidimicrobiales bacterium]|jgi:phenylpropionate dioxygenase-like ring-hydroxylating dioxygenase large terminal subunit|nr:Rieske 2Fe-2S domain-containing protein [Acidimicrobiales bacterium]MDP6901918.1 Rieske 2Fe-2S domain-containing protein [Acidimicrobiales bacterium]